MKRALAVVGETAASERLLAEAGELAAGVDADLVVLAVTPEGDYGDTRESRSRAGGQPYSVDQAAEDARQRAESLARQVLDGIDVEYEAVGSVGSVADRILGTADERDCDHVFVVGRRRSPTGKAIFGDVAQSVILNFDGAVTVLMDDGDDGDT